MLEMLDVSYWLLAWTKKLAVGSCLLVVADVELKGNSLLKQLLEEQHIRVISELGGEGESCHGGKCNSIDGQRKKGSLTLVWVHSFPESARAGLSLSLSLSLFRLVYLTALKFGRQADVCARKK